MKVLIIDDDIKYAELVSKKFKEKNLYAEIATSYTNAMIMVRENKDIYDCIICDYVLDKANKEDNGIDFARDIRFLEIEIPIVIISGFPITFIKPYKILDSGYINDFMEKPYNKDGFNELISRVRLARRNNTYGKIKFVKPATPQVIKGANVLYGDIHIGNINNYVQY